MKVELFPFQKKALAGLRMQSAEALGSYRRTHSPQVVLVYRQPRTAKDRLLVN